MALTAPRPSIGRPIRPDVELPSWPLRASFALLPLWFLLGMHGFMWIVLAVPMAAALVQKSRLVLPRGLGWWLLFVGAVLVSALSLDSTGRFAGWALRFGYVLATLVIGLYVLNGGSTLTVWETIRSITWLWMATVVGGYLAFVVGTLSYRAPLYHVMPGALLENELINTLVTPSFADVQNIIGIDLPRPKAPFNYTNTWGSMLALLTPFAIVAASERRVGLPPRLIRLLLAASVVPAVLSLNRGLWLSFGVGAIYVAIRLGFLGNTTMLFRGLVTACVLVAVLALSPLGDLIITRIATGHSNQDRAELITNALEGTADRPLFGWGAPRPGERGLPSVGTHGQLWYLLFSHGVIGAAGYVGFFASVGLRTWRQRDPLGLWVHAVLVIGAVQLLFYLAIPSQMITMMVAAMLAIRIPGESGISSSGPDAPLRAEPVRPGGRVAGG